MVSFGVNDVTSGQYNYSGDSFLANARKGGWVVDWQKDPEMVAGISRFQKVA